MRTEWRNKRSEPEFIEPVCKLPPVENDDWNIVSGYEVD
jgi:hypothetical protein